MAEAVFKATKDFALKGKVGTIPTSHEIKAGDRLVTLGHSSMGVVRGMKMGTGEQRSMVTMLVNMGPKDYKGHIGYELESLGPGAWVPEELRIKLDAEE